MASHRWTGLFTAMSEGYHVKRRNFSLENSYLYTSCSQLRLANLSVQGISRLKWYLYDVTNVKAATSKRGLS